MEQNAERKMPCAGNKKYAMMNVHAQIVKAGYRKSTRLVSGFRRTLKNDQV